jgi:outer membrane protein assembly factor BamB
MMGRNAVISRSVRQVGIAILAGSVMVGLSAAACGPHGPGPTGSTSCQAPADEEALIAAYRSDAVLDPATFGLTRNAGAIPPALTPTSTVGPSPSTSSSSPTIDVHRYCDRASVNRFAPNLVTSVSAEASVDQRDWFPLPVLYNRVEPILRGLGWAYAGYGDSETGGYAEVEFCKPIDSIPSVLQLHLYGPRRDMTTWPLPDSPTNLAISLSAIGDARKSCPDPQSAGGTLTPITHLPTPAPGAAGYRLGPHDAGSPPRRFWLTTDALFGAPAASVPDALYVATAKIGYDSFVYDLNPLTGAPRWRAQVPGEVPSALAVAGGQVYLVTTLGRLLSLDAHSGAQRWSVPVPQLVRRASASWANPESNPLAVAGLVCVGEMDTRMHCFDGNTGAVRWQSPVGIVTSDTWAHPLLAAAGNIVAVGSDHSVQAVDAATGAQRWRYKPGATTVPFSLAAIGSSVYVSTISDLSHELYQLDGTTGAVRWQTGQVVGLPAYLSPTVPGGLFFAGDHVGQAVDEKTGRILWESVDSPGAYVFPTPPVPSNSQVAIGADPDIVGLDLATGRPVWQVTTGQFQIGQPLITDDLICVSVTTDPTGNNNTGMLLVLGRR